jgi:hypothetical protein
MAIHSIHISINPIAGMVHRSSNISGAALDRSLELQAVLDNPNTAIMAAQAAVDGAIAQPLNTCECGN